VEVEVTLRLTVSQSVCLGIEHPCGTCDQILLPVGMLLSEICGLVSVGHPLRREDGSAIYSVITQWSCVLTRVLSGLHNSRPGHSITPFSVLCYDTAQQYRSAVAMVRLSTQQRRSGTVAPYHSNGGAVLLRRIIATVERYCCA
jgi:hypothetical protein